LLAENPDTKIRIIGVNMAGLEFANDDMVVGRTLPWLQDTYDEDVWGRWGVSWQDVVILDTQNMKHDEYSLSSNPIEAPANYEELKSLLKAAAGE
jgi:hypothetical protein